MKNYLCAGLDAGFQKWGFVLDNSKQNVKFLNIHPNSTEYEVILAKRGFEQPHWTPFGTAPGVVYHNDP